MSAAAIAADRWEALVDLSRTRVPLQAEELFGSSRPFEVEIGAGKGRFLVEWAALHPEIGLLGVERNRSYACLAAARAVRRGLPNVRLVHTTAEDLLCRCLARASVGAVHVYFPDPWPKRRHDKRRFFRADTVARLAEVLQPGGLLRVKTDHADYAAVVASVLEGERRLVLGAVEQGFAGIPETSYELKYGREGRRFYRFVCYRRDDR